MSTSGEKRKGTKDAVTEEPAQVEDDKKKRPKTKAAEKDTQNTSSNHHAVVGSMGHGPPGGPPPPHMMYPPYFPPMYYGPPPPYGYPPFMQQPESTETGSKNHNGDDANKDGSNTDDQKASGDSKEKMEGSSSPNKHPPYPYPPGYGTSPPNNMPPGQMMPPPFGRGHAFFPYPHSSMYMMMNVPTPTSQGTSLQLHIDLEQLSDYQILLRQQLELFEAGLEDIESNTQGRKKPVSMGQVGLRCRHCCGYPLRARGRGAVYYPSKMLGIYQAAQNMASSHLIQACQHIPPSIREELKKLRERKDNACGGKHYWADGCKALGVVETEQGLFFKREGRSQEGEETGKDDEAPKAKEE